MMPYLIEFMRFLCGFGLILAVSLTLLYLATPETALALPRMLA